MNVAEHLDRVAATHPDRLALGGRDDELSYEELEARAAHLAGGLRAYGLDPGDRLGVLAPNRVRTFVLYYACWKAGVVPAPVNVRLGRDEVAFLLADADVRGLVRDDAYADLVDGVETPLPAVGFADGTSADRSLGDLFADPVTTHPLVSDAEGVLLHTSGSTGRPKWVRQSHATLFSAVGLAYHHGLTPERTRINFFPLYHTGGIDHTLNQLLVGATTVIPGEFSVDRALAVVEAYDPTALLAVPTMMYDLVSDERAADCETPSLAYVVCGSDTVKRSLREEIRDVFGVPVVESYGMTEAPPVSVTPLSGPFAEGATRPVASACEVQIRDPDTDDPLPAGETGEIVVRGDRVALGYHDRPEEERETFRDGWVHSGDLGKFDADGNLYITGRLDDMIVCGGENVYPKAVEETLLGHEAVAAVAVVPVPDERKGQKPVAYVVREPESEVTEGELRSWFVERAAAFEHPRRVEFVRELPRTPIGKIDKRTLEEEASDRFEGAV